MRIITGTARRADHHIDATALPDPAVAPELRGRGGQDPLVRCWVLDHPETQRLLLVEEEHIVSSRPGVVAVACDTGGLRSAVVGDELARRLVAHGLEVTVTHGDAPAGEEAGSTPTLTPLPAELRNDRAARGYAREHKHRRTALINGHIDGTPCWWCGLPMYGDTQKTRNWDRHALARDHIVEGGARRGIEADRLMHFTCNSQRQDGRHDHLRPVKTGRHPSEPLPTEAQLAREKTSAPAAGFDFGGVTFA